MRKAKKLMALTCAALMASALLAGCSSDSGSAETTAAAAGGDTAAAAEEEAAPSGETVELELLISDDTLEGGAMAAMVEKFNEEFKDQGIQVKMNEIAYADM